MTKKHYIKIASALGAIRDRLDRENVVYEFCKVAYEDNPLFDRVRFEHAVEAEAISHEREEASSS